MSLKMELVFIVLILTCLHSFVLPDSQGDALYDLKNSLDATGNQLKDWNANQFNPCTWDNVNCDPNDNVISVILSDMGLSGTLSPKVGTLKYLRTLMLQGNDITGVIPEEYGNLSSLQTLNLERNNLTGVIPSSFGNLKKLQFLILSQNTLTGMIPESLSSLQGLVNLQLDSNNFSGQIAEQLFQVLKYNFTGNRLNCGVNLPHPCATDIGHSGASHKSIVRVIVGIVAGLIIAGLIVILSVGGFLCFIRYVRRESYRRGVSVHLEDGVDRGIAFGQSKRFSFRELQQATDNFNEKNVIGQGGFGKVYKGVLSDNTKVAVKRVTDYESPWGEAAFQCEVEMISVAVHRNLLRLIGFCATPTERLLVYPFMQNLSVAYQLREIKPGEAVLDWPTRKQVALGTARGLEYLHEHCNPKIIHRDVKAANVLLDEDFEAVVGDFGLTKLVDVRKTNVTTQVRGTWGYIAPEYISTGKASDRTDVFGYGIMLLELLTGQRVIDFSREGCTFLLDHVKNLEREKRLDAIVDGNLKNDYDIQQVEMMIQVALLCAQQSPEYRPAMSDVVRMLEGEGLAEWWRGYMSRNDEVASNKQRMFDCGEDSVNKQDAMELSGGR